MLYRRLGRTNLDVSLICLGTMTWGEQNSEAEGHGADGLRAQIAAVNFFDTAELYPVPPKADTQGETERIIGSWFAARGNRDKVILATKVLRALREYLVSRSWQPGGTDTRGHFRGGGQEPEAAAHRLHRSLPGSLALTVP